MSERAEPARLERLQRQLQALALYLESVEDLEEARRVRERIIALEIELESERERPAQRVSPDSHPGQRERRVTFDDGSNLWQPEGSSLSESGLDVRVELRMPSVPTSIAQHLALSSTPLVGVKISNTGKETRRLRVATQVEGYSAKLVCSREVKSGMAVEIGQFPPFFPERQATVNELTVASLHVEVDDLDANRPTFHETLPVRLLARQTAVLSQLDPVTGSYRDMRPFLGAWITPNAQPVHEFLRRAADFSELKVMQGYQVDASGVREHVRAIYETLKAAEITYINSTGAFGSVEGQFIQRVRLPSESLASKSANCIDGTVLMGSLLEATGIASAIVIVPGHAYLGWLSVDPESEKADLMNEPERHLESWEFVETTLIGSAPFEEACRRAKAASQDYHSRHKLNILPVPRLRRQGITPME